jgi:hypothetical protein
MQGSWLVLQLGCSLVSLFSCVRRIGVLFEKNLNVKQKQKNVGPQIGKSEKIDHKRDPVKQTNNGWIQYMVVV